MLTEMKALTMCHSEFYKNEKQMMPRIYDKIKWTSILRKTYMNKELHV